MLQPVRVPTLQALCSHPTPVYIGNPYQSPTLQSLSFLDTCLLRTEVTTPTFPQSFNLTAMMKVVFAVCLVVLPLLTEGLEVQFLAQTIIHDAFLYITIMTSNINCRIDEWNTISCVNYVFTSVFH